MAPEKRKRLRAAGWHAGTPREFLKMTGAEAALVEIKLALTDAVRQTRIKRELSQTGLAQSIKSSQSRVAKIEAGDAPVSLDLIARALLAVGATKQEVQKTFASKMLAAA